MSSNISQMYLKISGSYRRKTCDNSSQSTIEEVSAQLNFSEVGFAAFVQVTKIVCLTVFAVTIVKEVIGKEPQTPAQRRNRRQRIKDTLVILSILTVMAVLLTFWETVVRPPLTELRPPPI